MNNLNKIGLFFEVLFDIKKLRFVLWRRIYIKKILPHLQARRQEKFVKTLKGKKHINVVFLPMTVSMWKYQHLYELFKNDNRFRVYVFLTPATTFTDEQRIEDLNAMRHYFRERNVEFVDFELEKGNPIVDIRSIVEPDILFYTQPYERVVDQSRQYIYYTDKLICYSPYTFLLINMDFSFNTTFEQLAWKLYYQTDINKQFAQKLCKNKGRNVVVAGYPSADDYLSTQLKDVWKIKDRKKKRIIWAPHFTIIDDIGFFKISYFLEMADFMRDLAEEYSDRITIAFKPHPRLYSELCVHPDWGEEKTKVYYEFWEKNDNTQLETGDFVDLFKGSDAMIHDCGSFVVDYLYFGKPVLYDNPNIEEVKTTADELGIKAYDAHYRVKSLSDIKKFIDDVVLGGNDTMAQVRNDFYKTYLQPNNGMSASKFIYNDIVKSIWGDNANI